MLPRPGPFRPILMSIPLFGRAAGITALTLIAFAPALPLAGQPARLSVRHLVSTLEISWPLPSPSNQYFEIQRSGDLLNWQPIGERLHAGVLESNSVFAVTLADDQPKAFYRLLTVTPPAVVKLALGGDEVFGYGEAFKRELAAVGHISPDQFASRFPADSNYLAAVTWDPTTGQYWDLFNTDVPAHNAGKLPNHPEYRFYDTRLNAAELDQFKTNGFVIVPRVASYSFIDLYYKLWKDDLPVFITTDSILHAWHRTYDAILEELEESYLFNSVETLLNAMAEQLPRASADLGTGSLRVSLLDADYFLAVARSLLAGRQVSSNLGQDSRVTTTLADVRGLQLKEVPDFIGSCRTIDFSQFKPRGHYTHSQRLTRYFQAVMWIGRIDLAVAGGPFQRCGSSLSATANPRETAGAIILWDLLKQSGRFETWAEMEKVIETFVGWTDSMTFAQLGAVLNGAGIHSLKDVPDLAAVERLQAAILAGQAGVQNIRSDFFVSPLGPDQIQLPRAFTVFGQKFVPDSWVFSQTVFDSILWDGAKVLRRVPGGLDVAFAVFGNNEVVPDLVERMKNRDGSAAPHVRRFRDGLPYQHSLAAVRKVIDAQSAAAWDSNIYLGWIDALRALSGPTTGAEYPEAMRTRAWSKKTVETQLASWSQLRHDTVLYAKSSYTGGTICVYPAGFVEPRLEFWSRLRQLASRAADLLEGLRYEGNAVFEVPDFGSIRTNQVNMRLVQSAQVAHLKRFAEAAGQLERITVKELRHECLDPAQEAFIRDLIQVTRSSGSGPIRTYSGWYPKLFYRPLRYAQLPEDTFQLIYGGDTLDALVADVHTDVPCPDCGDPGSVLHEGIGYVNFLLIAVQNGIDRFLCAGPVLSHYEFEVIGPPRRLSDEEWQTVLKGTALPDHPTIEGFTPPPPLQYKSPLFP